MDYWGTKGFVGPSSQIIGGGPGPPPLPTPMIADSDDWFINNGFLYRKSPNGPGC